MESEETTLGDQDGDSSSWMDLPLINDSSSRGDKKKRFSEDQIKSLESMFQTQTKLDPRQKLQLAKELNLEPRQVAIWFQNKRARWKSKKLEKEYSALKSEYENLLSSFENLKKEKQMLLKQMQKLAKMLENKEGDQTTPTPTPIINDSFTPPCSSEDKNLMYLSDQDEQDLYTWQRSVGDEVQMQYAVDPLCGSTQVQSQWWDFWPIKE